MNFELKIMREIRIWGLGLGKCKECNLGTGVLNPGRKKKDNGNPNPRTGICVMK